MSALTNPGGSPNGVVETVREQRPTIAPSDLVLLVLAGLFVGGALVGALTGLSITAALAAACLPGCATVGYALFYDPPGSSDDDRDAGRE